MRKHQYIAVEHCIQYLKEHSNFRGLFINYGSRIRVKKIVSRIERGDPQILQFLRIFSSPRECATALNIFLQDIGKPLISKRVQTLLLSNNYGVCSRIVAMDALSLLYEDLKGLQRSLFISIMDMMRTLSTKGSLRPTELRVSHAPYLLMPILFSMTKDINENITKNWKSVADILNEMVLNFEIFLNGAHFYPNGSIYTIGDIERNQTLHVRNSKGIRTAHNNQIDINLIRNWLELNTSYYLHYQTLFI